MPAEPEAQGSISAPIRLVTWMAYGVGNVACTIAAFGISMLAPYVFNLELGMSPALLGLALSLPRFVDLFTDPMAGYLADRVRLPNGRRLFIALGSIFAALSFGATWWFPAGLSMAGYFAWLLVFGCLSYTGLSAIAVPLQALAYDMSADGYQRTRLMMVSLFMGSSTGIGLGWAFAATKMARFGGVMNGSRWIGTILAAAIAVSGLIAAGFCRERRGALSALKPRLGELSRIQLWRSTRRVFRSRPFLILVLSVGSLCFGIFSVNSITPFLAICFVSAGNSSKAAVLVGSAATAWQFTCMLLTAPIAWLSHRWGKRTTLLCFLGIAFCGALSKWFCYNPAAPWLYVIPSICFAAGCAAMWTLAPAMIAEVCDLEESRTGTRDGGMFAAYYLWASKLGSSMAFAIGGLLLSGTGFNSLKGVVQKASVIWAMRVVDFMFPALAILVAIWLVSKYSLAEERGALLPSMTVEQECGASELGGQLTGGLLSARLR